MRIITIPILQSMTESKVKLMEAGFVPGDPFPTDEDTRDGNENDQWAVSCEKVPKGLRRCHTKRKIGWSVADPGSASATCAPSAQWHAHYVELFKSFQVLLCQNRSSGSEVTCFKVEHSKTPRNCYIAFEIWKKYSDGAPPWSGRWIRHWMTPTFREYNVAGTMYIIFEARRAKFYTSHVSYQKKDGRCNVCPSFIWN